MKKVIALALVLLICLGAVACRKSDVPEGMKDVTVSGEPFILYVPENWTSNADSGISGAFRNVPEPMLVSAYYMTPSDGDLTVEAYLAACLQSAADRLSDFELVSNPESSVLGGADAYRIEYKAERNGVDYAVTQYATKYRGDMVTLCFYVPVDSFDGVAEEVASILDVFVLREREEAHADAVTDKHTPEGMKIASGDDTEYRLYVPSAWICSSQKATGFAYYPESTRSNVSVTSYSPAEVMTAAEHWEEVREVYAEELDGFEVLSEGTYRVANRDAVDVVYRVWDGTVCFRIRQTILVYRDMVYTVTYTAVDECFDLHAEDVDAMLDSFTFR